MLGMTGRKNSEEVNDFMNASKRKIIDMKDSKIKGGLSSAVSLREWLVYSFDREDLFTLFASMDSAMKYIHNKGYCICSFNPKDIEILNDSLEQIKFNLLMEMPDEFTGRKSIVKEDISRLVFLQIGIYSKCLNCLKPDFLKEHFDDFATFLPDDVVPYYRGVIERGASVYLGEYLNEKRKRDLASLEKEIGSPMGSASSGKQFVKGSSAFPSYEVDSMNTKVNDSIYKSLNNISDAAYISFLMIPMLVAILGIILSIFALLS